MKTPVLKIQLSLLFLCVVMLFINACHKESTDRTASVLKDEPAINAMKEKIKEEGVGISMVYPINEVIPLQLINRLGQFTTQTALSATKLNSTYVCDYPGIVNAYAIFESVLRSFDCGSGYKFTVTYNVSAPFNIVAVNPSIPTIITKGLIRLKRTNSADNSGGNVVYEEDNIPAVITPIGDDPGNTDNFLFRVTYTTSYITSPATVYDGVFIEPRPTFATDCNVYPGVGSGVVTRYVVWGSTIDPNNQPCTRTDKCFINPSMSGILGSIAGSDVFGACTGEGVVVSQTHDFEYREITGFVPANWATTGTPGAWTVVPVTSVSGSGTTNGTIGYWEVRTLPSTTFISNHVYEFRYRNRMVTGTGAPCQGAWSVAQRYMFY